MSNSNDFPGLSRIGQIFINVHDLARAVTFYRDSLGMKFLFEVPRMAFFDCGGVRLMLGLADRALQQAVMGEFWGEMADRFRRSGFGRPIAVNQ